MVIDGVRPSASRKIVCKWAITAMAEVGASLKKKIALRASYLGGQHLWRRHPGAREWLN